MLKANYHTHTNYCDGAHSPEDMVKSAISQGLEHIGFSGHFDPNVPMDKPSYKKEIRRLQEEYKETIDIFLGAEVDQLYDVREAEDCEYIIGSTHSLSIDGQTPSVDDTPEKLEILCNDHFGGDFYKLTKAYYELEAKVVDIVHPDFIGHFDIVTKFNGDGRYWDESSRRYLDPALETLEHLTGYGIPFEINTAAFYRGNRDQFYPSDTLLKALHGFGGRIILSSDAHNKDVITGAFDIAVKKAMECGFTHTCILVHENGRKTWKELPLDSL
ncbi:MAG: histidinol-phosphatase [Lachnospiraceae bacterium]|nr:histidinol-phosphatase [Lachnospiraceae bacterium]